MKRTWLIALVLFGCSVKKEPAGPTVEQRQEIIQQLDHLNASVKNGSTNLRIGEDYLALLHPRADGATFAQEIRPGSQIGVLDYTFGVDTHNLELALASHHVARARVHLINAVCARNRRCRPEDGIANGLDSRGLDRAIREGKADKQIRSRTAVFRGLSERYGVPIMISPLLEHDQGKEAWLHAATVIRQVWPGVQLINSPHTGYDGRPMGAWLERHGDRPNGDVSSLDGDDLYDISRSAWRDRTKRERYTLSWTKKANCLGSGPWIAPSKRKDCLRGEELKRWIRDTYN